MSQTTISVSSRGFIFSWKPSHSHSHCPNSQERKAMSLRIVRRVSQSQNAKQLSAIFFSKITRSFSQSKPYVNLKKRSRVDSGIWLGLILINFAVLPLALRSTSTASFYEAKFPSEAPLRPSEDYTTILVPLLFVRISHLFIYLFIQFGKSFCEIDTLNLLAGNLRTPYVFLTNGKFVSVCYCAFWNWLWLRRIIE